MISNKNAITLFIVFLFVFNVWPDGRMPQQRYVTANRFNPERGVQIREIGQKSGDMIRNSNNYCGEKTNLKKILILKGNKEKAAEYINQFMEHKAHAEMYKEK